MSRGKLIALSALAKEWGWSVSRLHRLVKAKAIPHLRIGDRRDVFFERGEVERWLAQRRVEEARATVDAAPRRSRSVEEECRALGVEPDPAFQ